MHTFLEMSPSRFCVYKEHLFTSPSKEWGDGLLDKKLSRRKPIVIEQPVPANAEVELFGFGTGIFESRVKVNGQEFDFSVLGDGAPPYPSLAGASINRAYHRTQILSEVIVKGTNIIELPPTHAYVQCLALRIFEADPDRAVTDLQLPFASLQAAFNPFTDSCSVAFADVKNSSFFGSAEVLAYYTGYDENMNGEEQDWHAGAEQDNGSARGYRLYGHAGELEASTSEIYFNTMYVPDSKIRFRARLRERRGYVVESPGGFADVDLYNKPPIQLVRPEGFLAVGFHEGGWNQEHGRCEMSFTIPEDFEPRSAVLRYAGYGEWRIILNERVVRENTNLPLACSAQDSIRVETASGANALVFESIGKTGCFQNPGPLLYFR